MCDVNEICKKTTIATKYLGYLGLQRNYPSIENLQHLVYLASTTLIV